MRILYDERERFMVIKLMAGVLHEVAGRTLGAKLLGRTGIPGADP